MVDVIQPSDCKSCLGMNIENLIKPSSDYKQLNGYQHSAPLRKLVLSSKNCSVCSMFLRFITKSGNFKEAELQLDQNELWIELVHFGRGEYSCILQLVAMTSEQPTITFVQTGFNVSTLKDDPAASIDLTGINGRIGASRLPWRVDVGENTKSECSFATAKQWLKDCLEGHDVPETTIDMRRRLHSFSANDHQQVTEHPRRLIDCFSNTQFRGTRNLRLRSSQSDYAASCKLVDATKYHQPYACLSYCWGSAESFPWVTTSVNVAQRETSFDPKALPNTLQDAIDITRGLNIRYLWIDALCILQDSQDEWLSESSRMDSIYGKALVTICAAASCSSQAGIFNNKSTSDFEAGSKVRDSFLIKSRLRDGHESILEFSAGSEEDCNPTQGREYRRGPLQGRGWCCQERHLSRRKIFYGSSQLYWECDHLVLKEDGSFDYYYVEPLSRNTGSNPQNDTSQELALSWYEDIIAADYSARQLSRSTDKLIAIAGLAKCASKMIGSTYLAGVWSHAIREGLLWKRHASVGRSQVVYRAPSWSWASQDSAIRFETLCAHDHKWHCEVIAATVHNRTADCFGAIDSAKLVLRAALLRGRVEIPPFDALGRTRYDIAFHLDEIGHGYACMDDSRFSSGPVLAALLCEPALARNRPRFLILKGSTKNEYRRIGLGWVDVQWPCLLTMSNKNTQPLNSVDTIQLGDRMFSEATSQSLHSTNTDPNYFVLRVEWISGVLSSGIGNIATSLGEYNATFTPTINPGDQFSVQAVPVGEAQGSRVYNSCKWLQVLNDGTFAAVYPTTAVPSVSTVSLGSASATSTSNSLTPTTTAPGHKSNHELSTGNKAGIAAACVIIGLIITGGIVLLIRRPRKTADRRKALSEKQVRPLEDADDVPVKPELPGSTAKGPYKKPELDGSEIITQTQTQTQTPDFEPEEHAELLQTNINNAGSTGPVELDSRNIVEMDGNRRTELD